MIHCLLIDCVNNVWYVFFFQQNLYPTVGLQTPGEVLEANFGQSPFVFDIEDYIKVVALIFV